MERKMIEEKREGKRRRESAMAGKRAENRKESDSALPWVLEILPIHRMVGDFQAAPDSDLIARALEILEENQEH